MTRNEQEYRELHNALTGIEKAEAAMNALIGLGSHSDTAFDALRVTKRQLSDSWARLYKRQQIARRACVREGSKWFLS